MFAHSCCFSKQPIFQRLAHKGDFNRCEYPTAQGKREVVYLSARTFDYLIVGMKML